MPKVNVDGESNKLSDICNTHFVSVTLAGDCSLSNQRSNGKLRHIKEMRGNLHFKDGIDDWKRKYDQVQQEGKSMRDHLDGRLMQDLAECYAVAKRRRTCGKVPAFAARLLIDVSAGKARGERAPEGADPFSGGQICPRSKTDVGDLVAFRYLVAGPGLESSLRRHLARGRTPP